MDLKYSETNKSLIVFLDNETLTVHKNSKSYLELKEAIEKNDVKKIKDIVFKKNTDKIKRMLKIQKDKNP